MARAARQVTVGRRLATADRRRLVVSVIGIGAALGLILLLEGLWTGLLRRASAYEEHVGAGFARQAETRALVEGAVPVDSTRSVRAVPGVDRADPVIARSVILDLDGTRAPAGASATCPEALPVHGHSRRAAVRNPRPRPNSSLTGHLRSQERARWTRQ